MIKDNNYKIVSDDLYKNGIFDITTIMKLQIILLEK